MTRTGNLVFKNKDATPKEVHIECTPISVPDIMAWYGGYYSGDDYVVTWNGEKVPMDRDGCALTPTAFEVSGESTR